MTRQQLKSLEEEAFRQFSQKIAAWKKAGVFDQLAAKIDEGNWKSSTSFSRNEMPLAIFCLARAFDKIIQEETSQGGRESGEEEVM